MLIKIKILKIKIFFKKLPRNLAENYFFTFLGFTFLAVLLGLAIFYQGTVGMEEKSDIDQESIIKFDSDAYQKVLDEWKVRDKRILEIETKEYINPF